MPKVTASIDIDGSPEAVWWVISDPFLYPDYVDATQRLIELTAGPFGLGYTYCELGGLPPFISEGTWEVTEYEPVHRQTRVGIYPGMHHRLDIELTHLDQSTRLTETWRLRPRWWLAPMALPLWPVSLRRRAQRSVERTLRNVKALVEDAV